MKQFRLSAFFIWLMLCTGIVPAQTKPAFWDEIQAFKKQDSIQFPPKSDILFLGSSSFTNWKDVQDYFPGYTIINRGFGGSRLSDQINYANEIIFPYRPRQMVIYCGENDIAEYDTVTGQIVFERFKRLFTIIRSKLPNVPVIYISMKPSPSRWHLRAKMITGNNLIKNYLSKKKNAVFLNIWNKMLGGEGKPDPSLFVEDMLHMNKKGYTIWQKALKPYLIADKKDKTKQHA